MVHCKMSPRARLAASMMLGKGLGPITVLNEKIDRLRDKLVPFDDELWKQLIPITDFKKYKI